jgi:hypothetical protein
MILYLGFVLDVLGFWGLYLKVVWLLILHFFSYFWSKFVDLSLSHLLCVTKPTKTHYVCQVAVGHPWVPFFRLFVEYKTLLHSLLKASTIFLVTQLANRVIVIGYCCNVAPEMTFPAVAPQMTFPFV